MIIFTLNDYEKFRKDTKRMNIEERLKYFDDWKKEKEECNRKAKENFKYKNNLHR